MTMIEKVARAILMEASPRRAEDPNLDLTDVNLGSSDEPYYYDLTEIARAAMKALLEPDDEMAEAAWTDTKRPTPEERMAMELCDNHTAFVIKSKRRFTAMIQSALSHNPGEEG